VQSQLSEGVHYETEQGVGVWTVDSLTETMESGALDEAEGHFREAAGDPAMNGCVVVIRDVSDVGPEVLDHVNDKWTALAEETEIDRTAYVSDGIAKMAISSKNEAEGMESKGFTDREQAVSWAASV
jgi:hypothetical protein